MRVPPAQACTRSVQYSFDRSQTPTADPHAPSIGLTHLNAARSREKVEWGPALQVSKSLSDLVSRRRATRRMRRDTLAGMPLAGMPLALTLTPCRALAGMLLALDARSLSLDARSLSLGDHATPFRPHGPPPRAPAGSPPAPPADTPPAPVTHLCLFVCGVVYEWVSVRVSYQRGRRPPAQGRPLPTPATGGAPCTDIFKVLSNLGI